MPTKPKKPARKPAAKKPAAVDYKKKYEALLKAAKAVSEEMNRGQIECICDDGREAIGDLRRAADIKPMFDGGEIIIKLGNGHEHDFGYSGKVELTLKIDGKKIEADDIDVEITDIPEEA